MKIDKKESERVGIKVMRTTAKTSQPKEQNTSSKKKTSASIFDEKEFEKRDD